MLRITRHPMLRSFAAWGAVHVLGNGDAAAAVFLGAFGVTALLGIPSLDREIGARDPGRWAALAAVTSRLPFVTIVQGRNRLVAAELALPVAVGALLWAALLRWHPAPFGGHCCRLEAARHPRSEHWPVAARREAGHRERYFK